MIGDVFHALAFVIGLLAIVVSIFMAGQDAERRKANAQATDDGRDL